MRSRLPPFPSSVNPPFTRPCLSLSPSLRLYPRFSLIPLPYSFLSPPFIFLRKRPDGTCDPQPGFLESFLGFLVLGISEFPEFLAVDRLVAVYCNVVHCIAVRRMCMCFASCFAALLLTLLCFALNCTPSHCLAFASITSAGNTLRFMALVFGSHGNVLICTAKTLTAFISLS